MVCQLVDIVDQLLEITKGADAQINKLEEVSTKIKTLKALIWMSWSTCPALQTRHP